MSPKIGGQIKCAVLFDSAAVFFAYRSFSSLLLLLSYEIFRSFILSTYIFICGFVWLCFGSSRINCLFFFARADRSKWLRRKKNTERISKVMSKYYRISLFCILLDAHVQHHHHHHSVFAMRSTHSFVLTELENGIDYTLTVNERAPNTASERERERRRDPPHMHTK